MKITHRILLSLIIYIGVLLSSCSNPRSSSNSDTISGQKMENDSSLSIESIIIEDVEQSPYSFDIQSLEKSTPIDGWVEYKAYISFTSNNLPYHDFTFPINCEAKSWEIDFNVPLEDLNVVRVETEEGYSYPVEFNQFINSNLFFGDWFSFPADIPATGFWKYYGGYGDSWDLHLYDLVFRVPEKLHPANIFIPCLDITLKLPESDEDRNPSLLSHSFETMPGTYQQHQLIFNIGMIGIQWDEPTDYCHARILLRIENTDIASEQSLSSVYTSLIDDYGVMWAPNFNCDHLLHLQSIGPGQTIDTVQCFSSNYCSNAEALPSYVLFSIGDRSNSKTFKDSSTRWSVVDAQAIPLATYTASDFPATFSYPAGWDIEEEANEVTFHDPDSFTFLYVGEELVEDGTTAAEVSSEVIESLQSEAQSGTFVLNENSPWSVPTGDDAYLNAYEWTDSGGYYLWAFDLETVSGESNVYFFLAGEDPELAPLYGELIKIIAESFSR